MPALFLFLLWELPAIIVMAFHKAFCAVKQRSFRSDFLGVWPYRLIGLFVVWPLAFALGALAGVSEVGGAVASLALTATIAVVIWARFGGSRW